MGPSRSGRRHPFAARFVGFRLRRAIGVAQLVGLATLESIGDLAVEQRKFVQPCTQKGHRFATTLRPCTNACRFRQASMERLSAVTSLKQWLYQKESHYTITKHWTTRSVSTATQVPAISTAHMFWHARQREGGMSSAPSTDAIEGRRLSAKVRHMLRGNCGLLSRQVSYVFHGDSAAADWILDSDEHRRIVAL